MAYGRAVARAGCGAAVGALLLVGCTGAGADGERTGRSSAGPSASASASASARPSGQPSKRPGDRAITPDPARVPRTEAQARALAERVVAGPDAWGPGYVRRTPHLTPPGHWLVLDEQCVWQRAPRPAGVLYSLTAHSELPAGPGKGPVRVAATVNVHRDANGADWDMAETLEETLRCPDQTLREGERVKKLWSQGRWYGRGNDLADDSVFETGDYENAEFDRAYTYNWYQARYGPVTVTVTSKGAEGHRDDDIDKARLEAFVAMLGRVETELGAEVDR
ncbi:hypothetical protein ACH4E8_05165 [Streptomyces sp. NPDC017979]|uniref:hypothetical protein n=1 Tax=Streptomyces sp. NPDC017979 TaxID=3365024 RepID=UPI00379C1DBC